jgi:hypothetical protein
MKPTRVLLIWIVLAGFSGACGGEDGGKDALDDEGPPEGEVEAADEEEVEPGDVIDEDGADLEAEACVPDPAGESCNGLDDDCNGLIDETFDLLGDLANCGACGNDCAAKHPSAPLDSTDPACESGTCTYGCLGSFFDANGSADDGCECLDTENFTEADPSDLGVANDCDGVFFIVTGKLPHDARHAGPFEEWYSFRYTTSATCDIELYLLFRSPAGTRMGVTLLGEGDLVLGEIISEGDTVKISEGSLSETIVYRVRVAWLEGESCEPYRLTIGDGCCSAECSFSCGTCNTDCPTL